MIINTSKTLHVYLKVTERCNINCSYCYYFNKGNHDFEGRDAYMKEETMADVASFLARSVGTHDISRVEVAIHGGEPLLLKRHRFDLLCGMLKEKIGPIATLDIAVQTNATLVDDSWIDLFERHEVAPSGSIDGAQQQNDVYRLDHAGRSTYGATARGIGLLARAHKAGRLRRFGVLVVVDPQVDSRRIYRHLVDELGVRAIDFLLPEGTHDRVDGSLGPNFARYLMDAFDEWIKDDNPAVTVRTFTNLLYVMANGVNGITRATTSFLNRYDLTIHSTGEIALDDRIRLVDPELSQTRFSVQRDSLEDVVASRTYAEIESIQRMVPTACAGCTWTNTCRGGDLHNRYSSRRGFNNPSVYCSSLMALNEQVAGYLLTHGMSQERLSMALAWNIERYPVMAADNFRFRSPTIVITPSRDVRGAASHQVAGPEALVAVSVCKDSRPLS